MPTENRLREAPREGGFTLIELMVVLVFIAVGILVLAGVQTHSFTDVYATGRHSRALNLAQQQMEAARGAGFTLAQSDSGVVDGCTWRNLVEPVDATMNRVTTTVTWAEGGGQRSVQLVNFLSSR